MQKRCSLFVRYAVRPLRYSNSAKHGRTVSKANARTTNNVFALRGCRAVCGAVMLPADKAPEP